MLEPISIEALATETVVLVSSGVDSMICAHAFPDARKVFVDYGHNEADAERKACLRLFPDVEVITLRGRFVSPDGVFVPERNLLFACLAAQYGSRIILGAMKDDKSVDKTPDALAAMSAILTRFGGFGRTVSVEAPFIDLMKHEAVAMYLANGGDPARLLSTWSCYGNGETQCWDCKACFRWSSAMRANGLDVRLPSERVVAYYLGRLHTYPPGRIWSHLKAIDDPARRVALIDIDGVLTNETDGHDYTTRTAKAGAAPRLRSLAESHWVVLWSSRQEADRAVTEEWLRANAMPYHALLLDKPPAGLLVDDCSCTGLESLCT